MSGLVWLLVCGRCPFHSDAHKPVRGAVQTFIQPWNLPNSYSERITDQLPAINAIYRTSSLFFFVKVRSLKSPGYSLRKEAQSTGKCCRLSSFLCTGLKSFPRVPRAWVTASQICFGNRSCLRANRKKITWKLSIPSFSIYIRGIPFMTPTCKEMGSTKTRIRLQNPLNCCIWQESKLL